MKSPSVISFAIFFTVFLAVYGAINFYIFKRGWQLLPESTLFRRGYIVLFLFFSLSYITARMTSRFIPSFINTFLVWTGSWWLAVMVYFFFSIVLIDAFRAGCFLFKWHPHILDSHKVKMITGISIISLTLVITVLGFINSLIIRETRVSITINKKAGSLKTLHIAVASDIHLGTVMNRTRLERIVKYINDLKPDIIFLPGDIIDGEVGHLLQKGAAEPLADLQSKFGVFAVTGNHEFIVGVGESVKLLERYGIRFLRDTAVKIEDTVYIVGRDDVSMKHFSRKKRKPLKEILKEVDTHLPVILLDHTPFGLDEARENGVDLQISGHTHNGQMFPFNFITDMIFEIDWGYAQKGDTHYYVSCGVGTWGPPVRIGSRAEIVHIIVDFSE